MSKSALWTKDETLAAFRLYCHTPFGRLHQSNPEIIALAKIIGRTPSAVGMKACNFAGLDPQHQARGVKGLPNRSHLEKEIWDRFSADSESVAAEAEEAYVQLLNRDKKEPIEKFQIPDGPTESEQSVRVRRVQGFFRQAVLVSYEYRCALTGLGVPSLLNASHIVPWSIDEHKRADPRNGLCLNVLHDRAFDRGWISFDEGFQMLVSPKLETAELGSLKEVLSGQVGRSLRIPDRFAPDREAMAYHRQIIFQR